MARELPVLELTSVCQSCNAACCREGTGMPLSETEAEFLEQGGTELERGIEIAQSFVRLRTVARLMRGQEPPQTRYMYKLETDCGYLDPETRECTVYNDLRRPKVCGAFPADSYGCRMIRLDAGIDTKDAFDSWCARTQS